MFNITIIGLIAASLTSFSGVPQLIKILKNRHTRDISLEMYIILSTGVFMWLIYGIIIKDIPLIAANTTSLLISLTILSLKLKYR